MGVPIKRPLFPALESFEFGKQIVLYRRLRYENLSPDDKAGRILHEDISSHHQILYGGIMEAKSITKLSEWLGCTEWEIFHAAYFWWYSIGETGTVGGYVEEFHLKGEIPNFVHIYLVGVLFPRLIIKGGRYENQPKSRWENPHRF